MIAIPALRRVVLPQAERVERLALQRADYRKRMTIAIQKADTLHSARASRHYV